MTGSSGIPPFDPETGGRAGSRYLQLALKTRPVRRVVTQVAKAKRRLTPNAPADPGRWEKAVVEAREFPSAPIAAKVWGLSGVTGQGDAEIARPVLQRR
jgi:hypothetical protein